MSTNYLALANYSFPTVNASSITVGSSINMNQAAFSTLRGSTITVSTLSFQSTTIALGQSTNQRYTNFTNGSFSSTLMTSTLTSYNSLSTVTKVSMSQDGRLQYALQSVPSTLSYYQLARSVDTGVTWNTLNTSTMGLPQGSLAYQSTVSGTPTYSNFSQSATGQYALAATSGGQLYVSNNANSATPVYTPANVGGSPTVYLPMDSLPITDMMGNTTITVTGSAPLVAGKVGTSAINLANTAGGTATNYVRGSWTGATNFTVSFWFNARTVNGTQQLIYSTYNGGIQVYIQPSTNYLYYQIPSGGAGGTTQGAITSFGVSVNTWYSVTIIFQTNGACSMYVNNTLIGSATNVGGYGTYNASQFSFGTYDTAAVFAFNGYIDDFRLYNFAAPNVVNPFIYLPLDGNVVDAMGNTTITPGSAPSSTAIPGYVFGAPVGSRTLSFENPASGTAVQFIRGSWTYLNNFTVSLWANIKNIASPGYQIIYSSHNTIVLFYLNPSNQLVTQLPSGSGSNFTLITTSFPITINTWYQLTMIFQINGLCSFYVNNSLIGTFTNSGGFGTVTSSTLFSLGTYDTATTFAFNGYIDDFRIYNYAITPSPITPMNWSHTAVSGTGQYMMAAAANGGVFCSTNYGATWSQLTASQISSIVGTGNAAKTLMGPIIQPNSTAASAVTWSVNGVTWTADSSSNYLNGQFCLFNTSLDNWASSNVGTYDTTSGASITSRTTTIVNIGTISGEWFQLQSSVPLIAYSFSYIPYNWASSARIYYIVGSNNGTTWFPIQYAYYGATNPCTNATTQTSTIFINNSSAQTVTAGATGTLTTSTYSTTTNQYTYFRFICTSIWPNAPAQFLQYSEFYFNFATPMPLLTAPSTASSTATSAVTVTPQMTNLASNTWTTPNGVTWMASASREGGSYPAYKAFNNSNSVNIDKWEPPTATYTGSAYSAGVYSTNIQTIGSIGGEYLQIQSSVPLVLTSYSLGVADVFGRMSKTYYIVGSNDNSTWYPIQYCNFTATPFNAAYSVTSYINANFSGTQTITAGTTGSATTTAYNTTTTAYTYFRMIITNLYSPETIVDIAEFYANFTAYTPNPVNALAITNGGQNMLVAATGTTMPNAVGVTPAAITTWTANGVTWTASGIYLNSNYFPYYAFNNSLGPNSWASQSLTYTTTPLTTGTTTSVSGIGTVYGDYLQIQSSVPIVMYSYQFATGSDGAIYFVKTFYIVGSNDGSTWYPIQYGNANSTQPTSSVATLIQNMIYVNSANAQPFGNSILTTTTYSTTQNAYTYFRLIPTATFNSSANVVQIGEWYINFQSGATYLSTNYGASWSTAVTAPTNAPFLATSGNGLYTITGSGQIATLYSNGALTTYTTPTLTGINANINCASISSTGQNMVILTQGTTNNVFYSTNFGVTFTGMTVGSAPMTSCAMSADGNEIMVSNAANVWVLNRNTQGFSITMGNQSGVVNQGQNSIAIGNLAGVTNQSANSIILNASGAVQDAYNPGLFVSPVATQTSSNQNAVSLLGYGTDNQVVQTGVTVLANGYVGIGTLTPNVPLQVYNFNSSFTGSPTVHIGDGQTDFGGAYGMLQLTRANNGADNKAHIAFIKNGLSVFGMGFCSGTSQPTFGLVPSFGTTMTSLIGLYINSIGYLGIGTTNPSAALNVYSPTGISLATTSTVNYTNTSILGFGYGGGSGGTRDAFRIVSQVVNRDSGAGPTYYDYGVQSDLVFQRKTNNLYSSGANDITYTEVMRISGTNNSVSIGTSAKSVASLYVFGTATVGLIVQTSTASDTIFVHANTTGLSTDGVYIMPIRVGSSATLTGGIYWSGSALTLVNGSDYRIKKDIRFADNQLDSLNKLNVKEFCIHNHPRREVGFIAHELQECYPNIVFGGKDEVDENGSPRIQQVNMQGLIPYMVKGIQELAKQATSSAAQIQELSEKATSQASLVQELAGQTAQLTAENTQLKSAIAAQASAIAAQASAMALLEARLAALEAK